MKENPKPPLSPHLQVYRLPLTALISIAHRITGVFLSIGALVLVWVLAAAAYDAEAYAMLQSHLARWYGQILLLGMAFSLYLHLCNGIRHLFWDLGMGFELKTVNLTAKLTIVSACLMTLATWWLAGSTG